MTINRAGETYGRLTLTGKSAVVKGITKWECTCICGNTKYVVFNALTRGATKSCGCLNDEVRRSNKNNYKHGYTGTPTHHAWTGMRNRCRNKKVWNYFNYGGRGITCCKRWKKFENFLEDMGPKPSPELSLDRIDNSKGYSKENCRWATLPEQAVNKRRVKHYKGEPLITYCRKNKIPYTPVYMRVRAGMSIAKAIRITLRGYPDTSRIVEFKGTKKPIHMWAKEFNINYFTLYKRVVTHGLSLEEALAIPWKTARQVNHF